MLARSISDRVKWCGAVDWDRRLFDSLIPLPEGTSYNAYLVQGSEKTALLDTADPSKADELFSQLQDVSRLDYLVSHHTEQDHSGLIPEVLRRYPDAKLVASTKAKTMLSDHLGIPADQITGVADGETLSLGDRTLEFIHTPWVHWPETMVTYLPEEKTLFTCDFFGAHLAGSDLYATDEARTIEAAKRYYAEIMMSFRKPIAKNLEKLERLEIAIIAPSHGPVWQRPGVILNAYREWVLGEPVNRAVLAYVSMHDSTRIMVEHLTSALIDRGVGVERFDLVNVDLGQLAMALVDASTLILASPTVLGGPHPHVASAAFFAGVLKPKARQVGMIGSFGWGGKMVETLRGLMAGMEAAELEPVLARGLPTAPDMAKLDLMADTIAGANR
jgi:flavorubredoxin